MFASCSPIRRSDGGKSRRGDTVTACEAALDGDTQNVAVPLRMVLSMEAMDAALLADLIGDAHW
jgi:hypothetical protein